VINSHSTKKTRHNLHTHHDAMTHIAVSLRLLVAVLCWHTGLARSRC